ncbi:MAG: hypothetical protein AB1726_08125 [Planctomycetota bacterium]
MQPSEHRPDALPGGVAAGIPPLEVPAYLPFEGEELYVVHHPTAGPPRARALLAGPFASERPHAYGCWVRWARTLAARGVECLRFDYRGTSESTGRFADHCLTTWRADVEHLARWLAAREPRRPLVLHGLRLGGLLAARAFFAGGRGDALLLWSPPESGQAMLHDTLRRRLATDMALAGPGPRRTREEYVAELLAGGTVEVEGFAWTRRLWEDAASHSLDLPAPEGRGADGRPWRSVRLERSAGPLADPYGLGFAPRGGAALKPMNPDLTSLFAAELAWILAAAGEEGSR